MCATLASGAPWHSDIERGPDQFDALTAIDTWVQTGTAPDTLLATKAKPAMTRPLCAYPKVATYKGSGDANDAASFVCK